VFLYTLIQILSLLINVVVVAVIVQFVLSLLLAFNVVNRHNGAVDAIWTAINAILDPILSPIRRFMPNTGAIDFSPMVLIILLQILMIILNNLAVSIA
jgi:YggT family protein